MNPTGPEAAAKLARRMFWVKVVSYMIVVPIALPFLYLALMPLLSLTLGIELPHIIYTPRPRHVALANPHHRDPTDKVVRPEEIQQILDRHPYDRLYQKDVFDCSDRSIITARLLQEEYGYDTSVVGDTRFDHAWVYVWVDKNVAWAIETAGDMSLRSAGNVVGDQWWDFLGEGHWFDAQAWKLSLTGFRLYYPHEGRDGLLVVEWYEAPEYIR